ncbi:MAG: hypothetical protein IJY62_01885 [Clostridia bacterium]|nr:hypothetical protein [Clostridia bacterium]
MLFWGVKVFLKCAAAVFCSLFSGIFLLILNSSYLPNSAVQADRREYYLFSPSSQATIAETYGFLEAFFLEGECAFYSLERIGAAYGADGERAISAFKDSLISAARATVCFEEEASGTRSYYCYSPILKGGVYIEGYSVNLHIAVREGTVAVGSPIVFGGY